MNWAFLGIIFIAALVCSCMGFKRFVWFLSIGYGYAVAGIAVVSIIYGLATKSIYPALIIGFIVCAAYGIRLGTFLLKRELGNKAYKKVLDTKVGSEPPMFVKIIVWPLVGVLYVCQTAGLHFRMTNGIGADACLYIGIIIMIIGAVVEAMSDKQKSAQKAERPDMVAMKGLFKLVRCPNYLGEILFWTGVTVSGITAYRGILQWVAALLGYVCIVYIMVDGAKRLEQGHISRYGDKEEYIKYSESTPILIPFIPLYHLYDPAKDKKKKEKKDDK